MTRPAPVPNGILAHLLIVFSLAAAALASCAGIGEPCEFDSDCSGGNLCIDQTCYAACSDEQDCEPPYEVCQAHARQTSDGEETVKACVTEDFGSDTNTNNGCQGAGDCCTDDAECIAHFGDEEAVCGIDSRCIIPIAPAAEGILIRDRTAVDPSEEPGDGGLGADIAAAYLRPVGAAQPVGFAVSLEYAPANDARGSADIFDGRAPRLDSGGACIDAGFKDHTASLGGEDGYLLLGFEDADGHPMRFNAHFELVVIEWGANCPDGDGTDSFDVFMCSADPPSSSTSARSGIDPALDCDRRLGAEAASGMHAVRLGAGG